MARKKNSVAPAAVTSAARRPPPARDLDAERSAQQLRSLNNRLVSEAVELRKQLHLLTSNMASTDTGRRVKGTRRNRAALSSRVATIAATTTVNPATLIAAEQKQSAKPGSELASISTDVCTVDPIEEDSFVLSSDLASTAAICAADNAPTDRHLAVEQEEAAEKTSTWVEVAAELLEQSKQVGSELASIHADRCDVAVHSSGVSLTSAGCADDLPLVEEEPEDLTAEEEVAAEKAAAELISEQGNRNGYELASVSAPSTDPAKNKSAAVNQVEEKKKRERGYSKWWICPAGILVAGITVAIFCKKSK